MNKKELKRIKRHSRIKMRLKNSKGRPRLVLRRSLKNIFAHIMDDTQGKVLFSFSTTDKEIRSKFPNSGNIKSAQVFGEVFAAKAKEKGIVKIVFDRSGYLYHGRIKAFAEALRKGGIQF